VAKARPLRATDRRAGPLQTRASPSLLIWALSLGMLGTISTRSLWIDEFSTAALAGQESPLAALQYAATHLGSEALMPGWVVLVNLLGQVLGSSELGIKIVNVLWLGLAVHALSRVGSRRVSVLPAIAFAVAPFAWYYGDEARPYALQLLLGSLWLLAAWRLWISSPQHGPPEPPNSGVGPRRGHWLMAAVVVASVLAGLTSAIIMIATTMAFVLTTRVVDGRWLLDRATAGAMIFASTPIIAWYSWSVLVAGASGARLWSVGVSNLVFAAYELGGFAGLGPGRLELREAGLLGLRETITVMVPYLPWLLLHAALAAVAVGVAVRHLHSNGAPLHTSPAPSGRRDPVGKFSASAIVAGVAGAAALFASAIVGEFPVWGRHFAPILPILLAPLALAWQRLLPQVRQQRSRRWIAAFGIMFLVSCSVSSLLIRLAPRHTVEDNRTAAFIAAAALEAGYYVTWFAAPSALGYYGLGLEGETRFLVRRVPVDAGSHPVLILLSKLDIHDPAGTVGALLQDGRALPCPRIVIGFEAYILVGAGSTIEQCPSLASFM
jgi:hypothetical protein